MTTQDEPRHLRKGKEKFSVRTPYDQINSHFLLLHFCVTLEKRDGPSMELAAFLDDLSPIGAANRYDLEVY